MIIPTENIPIYWSSRRRNFFRRCKFCYFLYCYGSWGGNDPDAKPETRELHRLKRLRTAGEYLDDLCARILREHFYHQYEKELSAVGLSRLRYELANMRDHGFDRDHNIPMLREFAETPAAFGRLAEWLKSELVRRLNVVAGGFYGGLCKLPYTDRLELNYPLQVSIGDLTCYTPAVLVFRREGMLCFADLSGSSESALFHRYCAMERFGLPPEGVRSYVPDFNSGIFRVSDNAIHVSGLLNGIRQDIAEMTALIHENGSVNSDDFPSACGKHCKECLFCPYCRYKQVFNQQF